MNTKIKTPTYNRKPTFSEIVFFYYLSKVDSSLIREYATPELKDNFGLSSIDLYSVDKNIAYEIDFTLRNHCELDVYRDNRKNELLTAAGRKVVRFRNEKSPILVENANVEIVNIPNSNGGKKASFKAVEVASKHIEKIYGKKIDVDYNRDKQEVNTLYEEFLSVYDERKKSSVPNVLAKSALPATSKPIVDSVSISTETFYGKKVPSEILKVLQKLDKQSPVVGFGGKQFENYREMAFTYELDYADFLIEFASGKKGLFALLREKGVQKKYETELGFFSTLEDVAIVYGIDYGLLKRLYDLGEPLDIAIELANKPREDKRLDVSIYDIPENERSEFIRTDIDGNVYTHFNILCAKHGIKVSTYQRRLSSGLTKSQCLSKF